MSYDLTKEDLKDLQYFWQEKQDLERLGLSSPEETVNLAQKAAEKGGKLTMQDMMKIHGT